ncbi:MAG: hypothetical protein SNJ64_04535 [Endomicrobiia bacterium]
MRKCKNFFYLILFFYLTQTQLFCIKTEVLNHKIFHIDNFDIYYSKEELFPIFSLTEDLLETTFVKETEFFNTRFDSKIPFFLYYGKTNFFQNTIVDVSDGTEGVTEAFKNRFLVPYEGSKKKFQHVINHEFIHEIQFNILYSGFWRTPRLLKSIFYPHWLMEGLAEYRAKDFVRTEQEMMVRDMSVSNQLIPIEHLHNFSHLKPYMILPAYEQSAKLMEYIVEEYGEKRIVDLLYVFKEKFDSNTVLNIVCGTNLKNLNKKFVEEMTMKYNYEIKINSMTDFDVKDRITKKSVFPTHYSSPVVYNNHIVYLGDPSGAQTFFINSLLTGKEAILLGKEKLKKSVDYIDTERISVSKNGLLCFTGLKNNKSKLFIYDINTGKLKNFYIKEIDFINSAYIFPDGNSVALSATKNSQSDIYIFNFKSLYLERITNDINYESHITVSPSGKKLAYYKELSCIKNVPGYENGLNTYQTDIYIYDIISKEEKQITNSLADEYYPNFISEDELIYVSDNNENYEKQFYGVYNLFCTNFTKEDFISYKLTNVIGGVYQPHFFDNKIYFSYYRNFEKHIYKMEFEVLKMHKSREVFSKETILHKKTDSVIVKNYFSRDYKFNFSTDLFLPFLYYSSIDGLAAVVYWQGSDMVGEHKIGLNTLMLGEKNLQYNINYEFARYRTKFLFALKGNNYYNYFDEIYNKQSEINIGLNYPVSRKSIFGLIFGYPITSYEYKLFGQTYEDRENIIYAKHIYSTLVGKYLEPTEGIYQNIMYQIS